MEYTIKNMNNTLSFINNEGKYVYYNGYAFMDKDGHCIIIVYGESRRDSMCKYLDDEGDSLNLKYKIINL